MHWLSRGVFALKEFLFPGGSISFGHERKNEGDLLDVVQIDVVIDRQMEGDVSEEFS